MPKGRTFSAETRSLLLGKAAPAGSTPTPPGEVPPSVIESFQRWIARPGDRRTPSRRCYQPLPSLGRGRWQSYHRRLQQP
eukprot:5676975-Lingulodinium_polyedra.AAC.1